MCNRLPHGANLGNACVIDQPMATIPPTKHAQIFDALRMAKLAHGLRFQTRAPKYRRLHENQSTSFLRECLRTL
jgi:hypothetical protein